MQFFAKQFQEVLPYCDIIFGNESEALAYGKANALETTDIATIAKHLQAVPMAGGHSRRTVIITQGKDPTLVVSGAAGDVSSFPVDALDSSLVVDTNGAGDSFCGKGGLRHGLWRVDLIFGHASKGCMLVVCGWGTTSSALEYWFENCVGVARINSIHACHC